jgi:hypothetical protein
MNEHGLAGLTDHVLTQLVALSNNLGQPALDYVILGEGNT